MNATPTSPATEGTTQETHVEHLTADAALARLAALPPVCYGHNCFTGSDVQQLRANPDVLRDAVLVSVHGHPTAMSWSITNAARGETLFAADVAGDAPEAVGVALVELLTAARARGAGNFVCRVPLESGWFVDALRAAGLHVQSQESFGGVAELQLDTL